MTGEQEHTREVLEIAQRNAETEQMVAHENVLRREIAVIIAETKRDKA